MTRFPVTRFATPAANMALSTLSTCWSNSVDLMWS